MSDAPTDAPAPASTSRRILVTLLAASIALSAGAAAAYTQKDKLLGTPSAAATADEPAKPIKYGTVTELDGIVVNPNGSNGRRYLMAKVAVELDKEKALELLTVRSAIARDAILSILVQRTVEELAVPATRDSLKAEIRTELNGILEGHVSRIYFTQYVLQ